ncbi:MAG: hypothetical protein RJB01_560 [Actinomycetota bacterium]|jgi:cysteine desulfurase
MTAARVYLDHAATSPMSDVAREAWLTASSQIGNPSSLHTSGRAARRIVEESREAIAAALNARPSSVIFTSGGTEADNLAIKGLFWASRSQGHSPKVITSAIEHHAVLDPIIWLEQHEGANVSFLPVSSIGEVDPQVLQSELQEQPPAAACSIMWANNEIGTIQPIAVLAEMCREAGVPFHTDAVQALGQVPIDITSLGATAVSLSSHKVGGPVGVGALVIDTAADFVPISHGGGQEREIRSGTLDAAGVASFAAALCDATRNLEERIKSLRSLQTKLVHEIASAIPEAQLNGPDLTQLDKRLPANVHFTFPGCEGDALLMLLDAAGIDCSTGSACTAGIPEPSHVVLALGAPDSAARGSLRFSLGTTSSQGDIDVLIPALQAAVARATRAGVATR